MICAMVILVAVVVAVGLVWWITDGFDPDWDDL